MPDTKLMNLRDISSCQSSRILNINVDIKAFTSGGKERVHWERMG